MIFPEISRPSPIISHFAPKSFNIFEVDSSLSLSFSLNLFPFTIEDFLSRKVSKTATIGQRSGIWEISIVSFSLSLLHFFIFWQISTISLSFCKESSFKLFIFILEFIRFAP